MALDTDAVKALSDHAVAAYAAQQYELAANLVAQARAAYAAEGINVTQGPDGGVQVVG